MRIVAESKKKKKEEEKRGMVPFNLVFLRGECVDTRFEMVFPSKRIAFDYPPTLFRFVSCDAVSGATLKSLMILFSSYVIKIMRTVCVIHLLIL